MFRSTDFNPDRFKTEIGEKLVTSHSIELEKLKKKNAAMGLDIRGDPLPVEPPKKEGEK